MTVEDILNLKERFDDANVPLEGRVLVLNPRHLSDLILFDVKAFKDITDVVEGQPKRFAGFSILQTTATPMYDNQTLENWGLQKRSPRDRPSVHSHSTAMRS